MNAEVKDRFFPRGAYKIRVHDASTGRVLRQIECENLIVNSLGRGYDLISRALGGDETYGVAIDTAQVGTGSNAPTSADTALQTPVLTGIELVQATYPTSGQVVLSFFIADAQLANGTYNEFGLFVGGRLFARSIISPALTKGSNQNVTVEYTITIS